MAEMNLDYDQNFELPDRWYSLKVESKGLSTRIWLDGKELKNIHKFSINQSGGEFIEATFNIFCKSMEITSDEGICKMDPE